MVISAPHTLGAHSDWQTGLVTSTPRCALKYQAVPQQLPSAFLSSNFDRLVTATRQTGRALEFWRRVVNIWASFKVTQASISLQANFRHPNWPRRTWDQQHHRAGDMMVELATTMKGFYVKAGQLIAIQDFVPEIIRQKLSRLQDDMPPMPPELAESVLSSELHRIGHSLDVFHPIDFANSIIGSASIAQVHRAVLREGDVPVAVKLQHPGTEHLMMSDLSNFRLLGELLQRTELNVDLVSPVQELRKQVRNEFDFENEARNMMAIRRALRRVRGVVVPEVVPGLVSRSMLVMSFLEGTPLSRFGNIVQGRGKRVVRRVGRKILRHLSDCYGKMVLQDGFFQADCHPGNIVIMNSNIDIGLLDFGQTKRLTEAQRINFARLVHAMARKDTTAIAIGMSNLGIGIKHNDNTVKGHVPTKGNRIRGPRTSTLTLEEKLAYTMFDTATVPGVSDNPFSPDSALEEGSITALPKDLVFLLRTMRIIRGISRLTHNSDFSIINKWSGVARRETQKAD